MATRQTAVTYLLTVTDTHGHEYVSVSGSLLHCLEIMGDRTYCFKDSVDTYSRIRRELVASGGAYSRFFASSENDKLPIHLVIINEALLPVKQVEHVEPIAPRGPLLPSVQRVIDALPGNRPRTTEDLDAHVAATTAARVPADSSEVRTCEHCKKEFYSNRLMRPRYCPTCASGGAGALASAKILAAAAPGQPVATDSSPVKNNRYSVHFSYRLGHGEGSSLVVLDAHSPRGAENLVSNTLGADLVRIQKVELVSSYAPLSSPIHLLDLRGKAKAERKAKPLTDAQYIEAKAAKLYSDAGLEMPKLPRKPRTRKK